MALHPTARTRRITVYVLDISLELTAPVHDIAIILPMTATRQVLCLAKPRRITSLVGNRAPVDRHETIGMAEAEAP